MRPITGRKEATIKRMVITETGAYQDMVYRPYTPDISGQNAEMFMEVTENDDIVNASMLSGIAGSIVRPSTAPCGLVSIENGWDNTRIRFMLEVEINNGLGTSVTEIFTGYSDHYGVSTASLAIDPNMRLYFNSVMQTRELQHSLPDGTTTNRVNVMDSSHLIRPTISPNYRSGFNAESLSLMRPADLFADLQIQNNEYGKALFNGGNGNINYDMRTDINSLGVSKSRRTNCIAADYLSRCINAVTSGRLLEARPDQFKIGESGVASGRYTAAKAEVMESTLVRNSLIRLLNHTSQYAAKGYVTYGELMRQFPELSAVTGISSSKGVELISRGGSEHFNGQGQETVIATILSHAIPAALVSSGLTKVKFDITNDTLGGQIDIDIYDIYSICPVDLRAHGRMFMSILTNEIFPDISHFGQVIVSVAMAADLMGNSFISISFDGGPYIDYNIPTFADGMFAPVITPVRTLTTEIASDIATLANTVGRRTETVVRDSLQNPHNHTSRLELPYNVPPRKTNFGI